MERLLQIAGRGHVACNGEHGALDGLRHGGVRAPHRLLRPAVDEPREQLREDHAAVAACPRQRPTWTRIPEGPERGQHVVPRVAVGDGEDVELVDLDPVSLEMRDRALEQGGQTAFVTLPAFRQRVHT